MIKGPKSDMIGDVISYIVKYPKERDNQVVLNAYGYIVAKYTIMAEKALRKNYSLEKMKEEFYTLYPLKVMGEYITGLYIVARGGELYPTAFEAMIGFASMGQAEHWDYFLTKELLGEGASFNSPFFNEAILKGENPYKVMKMRLKDIISITKEHL